MTNRQFAAVVAGLTVLCGFIAYANTFAGDWVWDDVSSVLLHEHVQEPGQFLQLFQEDQHAFGRGQGNFYRPLVAASFMLDFALSYDPVMDGAEEKGYPDVKPFLFHLTNILWHAAAAVLLFFLLARFGAPRLVQAVTPVLFVLHPMHTEAVAYISGRADMMSAVFIFAALLSATTPVRANRRWVTLGLSGLFFVLGLLSKESTAIYPVLLAVVVLLRPKPDGAPPDRAAWKARSLPLSLAVVILGIYGTMRMTILKFGDAGAGAGAGFGERLLETGQAFAFYMKTLFVPTGLHMEQTLAGVPAWTAAVGFLCLAACAGVAVWSYRAGHWRITMGLAWFIAAWLPISGLFPLNAPMAEHWMYVPMAGFWWAAVELVRLLSQRRPAFRPLVPATATVLALVFLSLTVARNRDWRDNESVFRSTLAANPGTLRVHANLATTYDYLEGNLPGARRHYEATLALYEAQRTADGETRAMMQSGEIPVRISLGQVLIRQRNYREAVRVFSELLPLAQREQFRAEAAEVAFGMGQGLLGLGDFPQAARAFQQAATLDPALRPRYRELLRGTPLPDTRSR